MLERRIRCLLLTGSHQSEVDKAHSAFEASLAFAKLDDAKKDKLRLDVSELLDGNNNPCHQEVHHPIPAEKIPDLVDSKPSLPALSSSVTIKHEPGRGRFALNCI